MKGQQQVIVLLEGDEARIKAFLQLVEKNKPEMAEVSRVTFEDYDGDVGRVSEIAMFCTFVQLDKAIPLLLKIQDNTSVTPQILEEIKGVREDIQPGYASSFRQMQADIRAIKERLGMA